MLGAGRRNFLTDSRTFSAAKVVLESTKGFHFEFSSTDAGTVDSRRIMNGYEGVSLTPSNEWYFFTSVSKKIFKTLH